MRVLIVDDDALAREMLRHALTSAGYEVATAEDGQEALELMRRESYHLVISDWEMPNMDGLELCRAIRSADFNGYVYFILLTRHERPADIVAGLAAGADDYITKPFENAELRMRLRVGERVLGLETRDVTIFALAKLAESRDPETGAHLERVRNYSRVLADCLSRSPKFSDVVDGAYVRLIYETSPLHDIGKVAIPDYVLLKPARLTDREYEIMKAHATYGAETLDAALRQYPYAQFLLMARDIAATHHEHYDGSGYPAGLHGEAIPLCGRIVALADTYDALTSRRVYKSPFAHDLARSIIVAESGAQFDPDVVDAFRAEEETFIEIARQYHEGTGLSSIDDSPDRTDLMNPPLAA